MKIFSILCFLLIILSTSIVAQGNDPDDEPSLQTEDSGMKKTQSEITKLKADAKKKSAKEMNSKNEPMTKEKKGKSKSEKKAKSEKKSKKSK